MLLLRKKQKCIAIVQTLKHVQLSVDQYKRDESLIIGRADYISQYAMAFISSRFFTNPNLPKSGSNVTKKLCYQIMNIGW